MKKISKKDLMKMVGKNVIEYKGDVRCNDNE